MCRLKKDGGKRCPAHKHTNTATIIAASSLSTLSKIQTERLFTELRREGLRSTPLTKKQKENIHALTLKQVEDSTTYKKVMKQFELSETHQEENDPASSYAQALLINRAIERSNNLTQELQKVADQRGITLQEAQQEYTQLCEEISNHTHSNHIEYNPKIRRQYATKNLPYDRVSLVALEQLKHGNPKKLRKIIPLLAPKSSRLHTVGYDNGRLEVTFKSDPSKIYAYKNVPEGLWDELTNGNVAPGLIYSSEIRGNKAYKYANNVEKEEDSYVYRCDSCGQYASQNPTHECPQKIVRIKTITSQKSLPTPTQIHEEINAETDALKKEKENNIFDLFTGMGEPTLEELAQEQEILEALENDEPLPGETGNTEELPEQLQALLTIPETSFDSDFDDFDDLYDDDDADPDYRNSTVQYPGTNIITPKTPPIELTNPNAEEPLEYNVDEYSLAYLTIQDNYQGQGVTPSTIDKYMAARQPVEDKLDEYYYPLSIAEDIQSGATYGLLEDVQESEIWETLTPEEQESFINRVKDPQRTGIFIGRIEDEENPGETGTLTFMLFNNDKVTISSEKGYELGTRNYSFIRKPPVLKPVNPETEKEHNTNYQTETQQYETAIQNKTLTQVHTITPTPANTPTFNGNMTGVTINTMPSPSAVTEAFQEGKSVRTNINISYSGNEKLGYDSNNLRTAKHIPGNVTGEMVFSQTKEGLITPTNTYRTLKCDCAIYKKTYYCPHVALTQKNMSNVLTQTIAAPELPNNTQYTQPMLNNGGVMVRMGHYYDADTDFSELYIFQSNLNKQKSVINTKTALGRIQLPDEITNNDGAYTTQQLSQLANYQQAQNDFTDFITIEHPQAIIDAINIPGTYAEAPITAYTQLATLTGVATYTKKDGKIVGMMRNLKCECENYQRNYTCAHTKFVNDNPQIFLPTEEESSLNTLNSILHSNADSINEISKYATLVDKYNLTSIEEARKMFDDPEYEKHYSRQSAIQQHKQEYETRKKERDASNKESIENSDSYREQLKQRWENPDETYTQNPEKFWDHYRDTLTRKRKPGAEALPTITENVTGGICAPGGRTFGIELEFDFPDSMTPEQEETAMRQIGEQLYSETFTETKDIGEYHSGLNNGYTSWSFEKDQTVAGEIVSPVLHDTPETWAAVGKILDIVKNNGGIATARTGSHVHVGTETYASEANKHLELMRFAKDHEDTLYRVSSNPLTGKHRPMMWCEPNTEDTNGDISNDTLYNASLVGFRNNSHSIGINMAAASHQEYKKSHVEMRMWDGTLNLGIIQRQVAVSAAVIDAAEHQVITSGESKYRRKAVDVSTIGTNRAKEQRILESHGRTTHNSETLQESSKDAMRFIETLFPKDEQRKTIVELFATTNWIDRKSTDEEDEELYA